MEISGKVYVVSGAGSGIGRALTLALIKRGAKVAAADLSSERLAETARLAQAGQGLSTHVLNITDREAVMALPKAVLAHHGAIDAVINNAGVIQPFRHFDKLTLEEIDRMVSVNLVGCINMTYAFLPHLKTRPKAHLANVASMGAFIPFPGQTMYSASKAAVKLLTEGLYAELQGTSVTVSVIMPGAVATSITENSGVEAPKMADADGAPAMEALPAEEAARQILVGIAEERLHILLGKDAKSLWLMSRLAPGYAIRMIQKQMRKLMNL